jgi:hypothetical protein
MFVALVLLDKAVDPVDTEDYVPGSYTASLSSASGSSLSSLSTDAGLISVRESWDEALPKLMSGKRIQLRHPDDDAMVDVREFRGKTYEFYFSRAGGGPYTLVRITAVGD